MTTIDLESAIDARDALWQRLSADSCPAPAPVYGLAIFNDALRAILALAPPLSAPRVQLELVRCNLCQVFLDRVAHEIKGRITDVGMSAVVSAAQHFIAANAS